MRGRIVVPMYFQILLFIISYRITVGAASADTLLKKNKKVSIGCRGAASLKRRANQHANLRGVSPLYTLDKKRGIPGVFTV